MGNKRNPIHRLHRASTVTECFYASYYADQGAGKRGNCNNYYIHMYVGKTRIFPAITHPVLHTRNNMFFFFTTSTRLV